MGPEKPITGLEKLATRDKATIVIERQPDGKIRVTTGSEVFLPALLWRWWTVKFSPSSVLSVTYWRLAAS